MAGTNEKSMVTDLTPGSVFSNLVRLALPFMLSNLRGMGDSKRPLVFIGIASLVNVVLDILFVGPMGLQAAGAAWATIIAQAVSFLISVAYLYKEREAFGFDFRLTSFRIHKNILKILLRLGLPAALQHSAISISMLFINGFVNVYGLAASAAFGVGRRVEMIPHTLTNSVSMAVSTMVGHNMAAGEVKRSKRTVWYAFGVNMSVTLVGFICFALWPRGVFSIFTQDESVLELSGLLMTTILIGMPAFPIMQAFNPFIQGIGNARLSLIIGLMDGVVARIGLCLLFERVLDMGLFGVLLGYTLATYVTAIPAMIYFLSGVWKKRKLLVQVKISLIIWFSYTSAFQKSRELCECRVLLPIGIIVLFTELLFRLGQLAFQLFDPALIGLGTQLLLQLLLFLFLLFDFPVHLSRIAGPFFLRLIGRARCPLGVVKMDFGPAVLFPAYPVPA